MIVWDLRTGQQHATLPGHSQLFRDALVGHVRVTLGGHDG